MIVRRRRNLQRWPETYPPHAQDYYVLAVLIFAYIVSYMDRTMLTLLIDPIRATLNISDFQISLLHGLAFAIFHTLLGLPMGRIADRYNRRNLIVGAIVAWSIATAFCGFARSFWQMFVSGVGVGVGEAKLSPAAYSTLSSAVECGQASTIDPIVGSHFMRISDLRRRSARNDRACLDLPAQFAACRSLVGACMGALYLAVDKNSRVFSYLANQCGGYTDTVRRRSLAFEIAWTLICPLDLNEPRP